MFLKLIICQVIAFFLVFTLCKIISMLTQKIFPANGYRLTKQFYHILTYIVMIILGIIFGRELLYVLV
jgi:hypothetical protein